VPAHGGIGRGRVASRFSRAGAVWWHQRAQSAALQPPPVKDAAERKKPCDQIPRPTSATPRHGTREPFCAGKRRAAETAGGCGSDPDHLPRPHKGTLIPRAGGGGERPSTPSIPLRPSGKARCPVTVAATGTGDAGPGNPTPVGTAPTPHVGGIFPAGILASASRFFS